MTMWDPHRRSRRDIAAHFAGRGAPSTEQRMRLHLRDCAACLDFYQRQLLIAEVDPAAVPAQVRLARGLGLSPAAHAGHPAVHGAAAGSRAFWSFGALAGAAAMGALLLVVSARPPRDAFPAFVARGAAGAVPPTLPELMVYRVPSRNAAPEPAGAVISARDELAFAYRNSGGQAAGASKESRRDSKNDWLLIFAVDEHGHVYWYHPGWTRATENPSAVPASRQPGIHELPSAVAHQFDGKTVVIHALFSDRPLTVRQVEAAVAAGQGGGAGSRPGRDGAGQPLAQSGTQSGRPPGNSAGNSGSTDPLGAPLPLPGSLDVRRAFTVVP